MPTGLRKGTHEMSTLPAEPQTQTQTEKPAYTAPATQADLDRIIADRVSRERAKYLDYDDLKTKAGEFDKLAEAQKSELQKAQERAEAAEKKAGEYEAATQRTKWAEEIAKGSAVPATALRGATREDLQAHFEELKALIPEATKKGAVGPYVPGEGTTSAGNLGGPGQEFADWFNGQLGR